MAFEDLEAHLIAIGISPPHNPFKPDEVAVWKPIDASVWKPIEVEAGSAFPDVVRWLFARFGSFSFRPMGAYYFDPRYRSDVMLGWFLDAKELADVFEYTRENTPRDVVPLFNDGGDNFVCVRVGEGAGDVWFSIHDAPLDKRLYKIHDSIETFLRNLRAGTDND